jgi:hypothetical protein
MTEDEAKKVIAILLTADGGCQVCVRSLMYAFIVNFGEYKEIALNAHKDKFGNEEMQYLISDLKEEEGK